jgi:hypothetical protein
MKKTTAILLALIMVMGLAACNEDNEPQSSVSPRTQENNNDAQERFEELQERVDNSDNSQAEGLFNLFTPQLGVWDGDTLINEWAGIKFTVPAGLTRLSAAEIAMIAEVGTDVMINDGQVSQHDLDLAAATYAYEFFVAGESFMPQMFLMYQRDMMGAIGSPENYVNTTLDMVVDAYLSLGMAAQREPSTTLTIAGEEYYAGSITFEAETVYGTMKGYQDFVVRKEDGMFIVFGLTYAEEEKDLIYNALNSITAVN